VRVRVVDSICMHARKSEVVQRVRIVRAYGQHLSVVTRRFTHVPRREGGIGAFHHRANVCGVEICI
jgi:hypothetical protein